MKRPLFRDHVIVHHPQRASIGTLRFISCEFVDGESRCAKSEEEKNKVTARGRNWVACALVEVSNLTSLPRQCQKHWNRWQARSCRQLLQPSMPESRLWAPQSRRGAVCIETWCARTPGIWNTAPCSLSSCLAEACELACSKGTHSLWARDSPCSCDQSFRSCGKS